jgi:MFS family permease
MGMIGAAFGIGFVLGPAMAGLLLWLIPSMPNLPYFVAAAMALANTVFIVLKLPESLPKEKRCLPTSKVSLGAVLQSGGTNLKFTMAAYFVSIMAFSIMTALFALLVARKLGLDSSSTGLTAAQGKVAWLMALVGIVGAVIQGRYIGKLAPKFGERRLAITGAIILGAFLVILQETDTMLTFSIVSIGIAIGNALVTPCLNSLASRSVDGTMQGRSSGLMASSGSLGRVFGPLSTMFDIGKPFYMAGAIMVVALGLILFLKQPEPTPTESPT